ncbi:MAG TPA: replicative DNA helicase [Candidatus Krumholzibacteria bacterium]|nr:replicative DNA helicase [Candidatus Krumholzibacteria bacterium]
MADTIRANPTPAVPGRVPPQSLEAEMAVLGAVLLDNNAFSIATESITSTAFYKKAHSDIFAAMEALSGRGEAIDVVTLSEELKSRGTYQSIGGAPYLTHIMDQIHTAANVEYYANIVLEKFVMRRLITICNDVTTQCFAGEREAAEVLDEAERHIFEISQQGMFKGFESIGKIIRSHFKNIEALYQSGSHISGMPSPFEDLDSLTSGFQKSDLIIIAGRPGMGKTSFALNLGQYLALKEKTPVGVFSLEMSSEQLVTRLLCSEARIDSNKLRRGYLKSNEYAELAIVAGYLAEAPIYIDDSAGLTTLELRAKARRLKAEANIGMIIVDYLQLVSVKERVENRQQQISLISRGLKALAKELEVPVLALSQLSRAVESRGGDKRPMLSDLRESGCLAGDSLVTMADTGDRVPIANLAGHSGFNVWAVNTNTWKLEKARVSRAFSTGVKPVFHLESQLGRSIRATANHKFLTINGWKRLDELRVGEHIALPRALPTASGATMTNAELALLGHLIGDGCTLPRHAIQYTTREYDLAVEVSRLTREVFGARVEPRIQPERKWFQVYLSSTRHHTHGVRSAVSEWLDGMGVWGLRAHEKRVPPQVFKQPAEQVATFLKHLWSTDGCVRMRQKPRPYPAVYYATSSRGLAMDVQSLLLRLGINARVRPVSQGNKGRSQYHIIVSGIDDLRVFAGCVGAVGAYKAESLRAISSYICARDANTNRDVIPMDVWQQIVVPAMRVAGMTRRALHVELGMAYGGMTIFRQNLGRARASAVAQVVSSKPLQRLAGSDVYWDRVAAVTPAGEEEVFDLTVPGPHNFVANDIVAHNSIEQDADVVLFLYRPEVYDSSDENRGKAELIIGKQRNGPTGTVNLTFIDSCTRFEPAAFGD